MEAIDVIVVLNKLCLMASDAYLQLNVVHVFIYWLIIAYF